MTFSVNKVCLAGNVGGDPDVKRLQSGKRVANLMLATNEAWTHQGKPQERTDWHRIVFLSEGHIAAVEELVRNGSLIYLNGVMHDQAAAHEGTSRFGSPGMLPTAYWPQLSLSRFPSDCRSILYEATIGAAVTVAVNIAVQ